MATWNSATGKYVQERNIFAKHMLLSFDILSEEEKEKNKGKFSTDLLGVGK